MWIQSHQSLSRHRKTLEAVALLRVDRHKFIGHLHELWWWGLDNADTDGKLGQVPTTALASAADWPMKDADRFVEALVTAGFIDHDDAGYVLHDWFDYAGKLNQQRAKNRDRMTAARVRHVQRTNGTRAESVQRTFDARAPAREEESREDKRRGPPVTPPTPVCRTCNEQPVYAPPGLELPSDPGLEGLCARCLIVAQQQAKMTARA